MKWEDNNISRYQPTVTQEWIPLYRNLIFKPCCCIREPVSLAYFYWAGTSLEHVPLHNWYLFLTVKSLIRVFAKWQLKLKCTLCTVNFWNIVVHSFQQLLFQITYQNLAKKNKCYWYCTRASHNMILGMVQHPPLVLLTNSWKIC